MAKTNRLDRIIAAAAASKAPPVKRYRPTVAVTLSPEELGILDAVANVRGLPRSRTIAMLAREEHERTHRAEDAHVARWEVEKNRSPAPRSASSPVAALRAATSPTPTRRGRS